MKKKALQNMNFYLREYEMKSLWEHDLKERPTEDAPIEVQADDIESRTANEEMILALQKELEANLEYTTEEEMSRMGLAKMIYGESSVEDGEEQPHKLNKKA